MRKNSDLHMHSTASDGGYSPSELMYKCKKEQLEIVSLTDHDTVAGIFEAITTGNAIGLTVIPGIELSTMYNGKSVHILGYGIDWKNEQLLHTLQIQHDLRIKRLNKMIEKLANLDIYISKQDIIQRAAGASVGRPHIAQALVKEGYVTTVSQAFDLYLAEGKPVYVEKEKEMTVKEAIDLIHKAGGLAIVAHPIYYNLDEKIHMWVDEWKLDGIEVYHRDHDKKAIARYELLCDAIDKNRKVPLFRTGGSDFHHEKYGRVIEPLGVTRIKNSLAKRIIQCTNI